MLKFENFPQGLPDEIRAGITALWRQEGALTDDAAIAERLSQIVYVITEPETNQVVGVSTAVKKKVNLLNRNYLYEFRCYIGQDHRIAGLDIKICRLTIDYLEALAMNGPDKPIGVFTVLLSDYVKQQPVWRRAVWPETEMCFIGYNKHGNPIRVKYFKDARI